MITKEYLKSLNPCADRFKNYLDHYAEWSGSLVEFLDLKKISHFDKVWVFVRSVDKKSQRLFAADCAENVLHLFESKYPNDDRPRKAIKAARADAAVDAAAAADAAYAAAVDAAYAAAVDAAYAADSRILEEQKQLELMKKYAR